jgi:hypothetical protein
VLVVVFAVSFMDLIGPLIGLNIVNRSLAKTTNFNSQGGDNRHNKSELSICVQQQQKNEVFHRCEHPRT